MFSVRENIFLKAAAIISCFFLFGCENDINEIRAFTSKKISVEEGTHIISYMSQQAKLKARLTAPLMKRYLTDSPYVEFPKTLHVDFYDSLMNIETQLDARYGRYKQNENRVFLKDSVMVFNTKGDTLHCMELWWDQQSEKYYTDKPVRINSKNNQVLYGQYGLVANQDLTDIEFKSGSGRVLVPEQGLID